MMRVSSDLTAEEELFLNMYQSAFATSCRVTTSPKAEWLRGAFISESAGELASSAV